MSSIIFFSGGDAQREDLSHWFLLWFTPGPFLAQFCLTSEEGHVDTTNRSHVLHLALQSVVTGLEQRPGVIQKADGDQIWSLCGDRQIDGWMDGWIERERERV